MNVLAKPHRDMQNDCEHDNMLIPCSVWQGGEVWLKDSGGDTALGASGPTGRLHDVTCPLRFHPRAGHDNSPRVRFMPVLHFTRQLVARHLREVTVKENTVLNQLKFNKGEVAQFRGLFKRLCGEYAGGMRPDGQTPVAEAPRPSMKSGRRRSMDDGGSFWENGSVWV
eukprot:s4319_g5.t1